MNCKVFILCPTYRSDDSKTNLKLLHLRKKVSNLKLDVIMNDNIVAKHIGQKGLHLNKHGAGRLAVNFMSHMRRY